MMKPNILLALSEKSFSYLWIGEIFTQLAINLFNFFLILIVFEQTQSNTAVSGIVISFTIPAILFGSLAGVYVDRWSKKKVLIVANLLRAALLIVLAASIDNIIIIYIISFAVATFTQFFIPAETPMVPLVVKEKNLLSANALFGMGIYGSIVVAYMLSGPLLIYLRPVNTLLLLAACLILGALFILLIKPKDSLLSHDAKPKRPLHIIRDIKETLAFMSKASSVSSSLFALALAQILILIIVTIAPGYAQQILKIKMEEFFLLFAAPAAIGMLVGAVCVANFLSQQRKERIITAGILLSGVSMMFLPFGSRVASRDFIQTINTYLPSMLAIDIYNIIIVVVFTLGFANAFVFVPANTIIQQNTSEELRGKIYGFLNTLVGILSFLPIIIVGGLADLIGVGSVLFIIGICLFVMGLVFRFLDRR